MAGTAISFLEPNDSGDNSSSVSSSSSSHASANANPVSAQQTSLSSEVGSDEVEVEQQLQTILDELKLPDFMKNLYR
jgi:hypothetical protein